ncbi:MAG: hypothetical protein CMB25_08140 [Euryarchaeota archaeon]|nr:hypothetical protein [Euryarchaeota archaeon]
MGQKCPITTEDIMKVKITTDRRPFVNGVATNQGEEIEVDAEEGAILLQAGFALEIGASKPKRARTATGKLKADDPSTPDVNEAWEGGKAPKKKKAKK